KLLETKSEKLFIINHDEQLLGYIDQHMLLEQSLHNNQDIIISEFKNDFLVLTYEEQLPVEDIENYSLYMIKERNKLIGFLSKEEVYTRYVEDKLNFIKSSVEYARFGILSIDAKGRIKLLNR